MKQYFTKNRSLVYFIFLLSACVSPDPSKNLSPADQDLYITNKDMSVSFSNYKTYAIVDSVFKIDRNVHDSLKSYNSDAIISNVNLEMQRDGFVLVGKAQNPDVGVNISVLKFFEIAPNSYFSYTNPASGYLRYPAPATWGYLDYQYFIPSNFAYDQISDGSIAIEIVDLKNANAGTKKLNIIWSALVSGGVSDTTNTSPSRISSGITNVFNQSPYLKDGK